MSLNFKLEQLELSHLRGRLLLGLASLYKAKPIAKFIHLIVYNKTESSGVLGPAALDVFSIV